jgi:hypothetical protein
LKLLHDPSLLEDVVRLRKQRALPRAPARPIEQRWVYASQGGEDSEWVGQPLHSYQLQGEDGWHFCDHGDGEGVVYWWPPPAERGADATLIAMPVELLTAHPDSSPSDKLERTFSWPPPPTATIFTWIQDVGAFAHNFLNGLSTEAAREAAEVTAVYDRVDRRLAESGLVAVEVGGDGDCFFRALAHQLYGARPSAFFTTVRIHT